MSLLDSLFGPCTFGHDWFYSGWGPNNGRHCNKCGIEYFKCGNGEWKPFNFKLPESGTASTVAREDKQEVGEEQKG